jgi:hypothetical protein
MSKSTLEMARDLLAMNIYPVPVKAGTKMPPMAGWPDLRLTIDDLPTHFSNGNSLGLLLGIKPRPICDVDLDCPEALAVARMFEHPKTDRISGRASSRNSHYFFELPEEFDSEKFEDPILKKQKQRATIIELRGPGGQTVVPPSMHESGERRHWEREGEFGVTTHAELSKWVRKTGAAALLIRYWPRGHETRFALAGMLGRAGWNEKEAVEFVSAVVRIAQPENREAKAEVRNTYEQLKQGEESFGRPKLIELLGEHGKLIVRTVIKWLGIEQSSSGLITNDDGTIKPIVANAITMLKTTPCWEGVLAYNELTLFVEKLKPAPWEDYGGSAWLDHDDIKLTEYFQRRGLFINSSRQAA